jgi:hypothetical protein
MDAIQNEKIPLVTLISLIYAGVDWLEFQYGELLKLKNELGPGEVEILFVANNASQEIINFLRDNLIPYVSAPGRAYSGEWYINSVYRAYNYGVACAKGEYVLLTNSDMSYSSGFLIELLKHRTPNSYLVGKLIESGRLTPAKSAIKKNLGKKLRQFKRKQFYSTVEKVSREGTSPGGLFMPLLTSRMTFLEAGSYPEGNIRKDSLETYTASGHYSVALQGEQLVPGDYAFVKRLEFNGWKHRTLNSAIAYHFQEGEKSEMRTSARSVINSGIRVELLHSQLLASLKKISNSVIVSNSRLTVTDSLKNVHKKGNFIFLANNADLLDTIKTNKLVNVTSCITSDINILKHMAIGLNIHTYLVEELTDENFHGLNRVFEDLLAQELEKSFLPTEPKKIRLILSEALPPYLKRIIRFTRTLKK